MTMPLFTKIILPFLLLTACGAAPLVERSNPSFPDPNVDPFYDVPSNILKYKDGQPIRNRNVPTEIVGAYSSSHQVLFRTNDNFNNVSATVMTIWIPEVPSTPPKIFAYQFAEDGDNLDCAPSWAWVLNSGSNAQESERLVQGPLLIPWALTQGYYVVSTDAEGPHSTWLVGRTEGKSVLDAVRAATSFAKLNKPMVALYGYSGGAHTTVWASTLHASYAPDVNIVGAAFGGTPTDLRSSLDLDNDMASSEVVGAAIFGLANGYPQLNKTLNKHITSQGKEIASNFRARDNCTSYADPTYSGAFNYLTIFDIDILTNSVVSKVLAEESLLVNVSSMPVPVPKFPRYEYHGTNDTTVSYPAELEYVQQQCRRGANIQFTKYVGLDHAPAAVAGLPGAMTFIEQSFAGTTPKVACGSSAASDIDIETLFGPQLAALYEQDLRAVGL